MSKKHIGPFLSIGLAILTIGQPAYVSVAFPQGPPQQITTPAGRVIVPPSSIERPEERGLRAHTNHLIFVPQVEGGVPAGENPTSLACVYNIVTTYQNSPSGNCPRNPPTSANPVGGSSVIAIVDAYDYPTAATDLAAFSTKFGLPPATFQVVYANGQKPSGNCGWNQEAALDIEWAHAMAPSASIVLVEAASNSLSDLLAAVDKATSLVQQGGGGQVSMSWGSGEFPSERNYDYHFNAPTVGPGVAYFASSGDTGGKTIWPGVSPNVVSAGGTRVNRDSSGNFTTESAWSKETCGGGPCGGGGGPSRFERRPPYQDVISGIVGSSRGTPDFSFDADPYTGVAVYGPTCSGTNRDWMVFGGTSVSSPALAGIVNLAGQKLGSGSGNNNAYYEQRSLYTSYPNYSSSTLILPPFRDITSGNNGYPAASGWDFATGIGSNQGLTGK